MAEKVKSRKELSKHNTFRLMIWTVLWTLSVALVTFGARYLWDYQPVYSVISILLNILLGIGMIRANIKYLQGVDEMVQKIYMDAMGIALGVALVGGMAYSMLDTTNVISSDAEISILIVFMAVAYMVTVVAGYLRYK